MNLHGIVTSAIGSVNPFVTVTVRRSTGSTTNADGTRTPTYTDVTTVPVQVQSLTFQDLQHLDGLNIQGVQRAIYLSEQVMTVVRVGKLGGDLLVFPIGTLPEGTTWLATHALERWPDWCKIAITLQNGS